MNYLLKTALILSILCHLFSVIACDEEGNVDCPEITVGDYAFDDIGDLYWFGDVQMFANCLYVEVSYGGGCEIDEFELRWNGSLAESFPPQAFITLWHDDFNDPCDAIEDTTLMFDLSSMKVGNTYETILVHLFSYDTTLVYSFNPE